MAANPDLPHTAHREKKSRTAVLVGLLANLILAAVKISVGIIGHSPALLADGINSTSDVAYYVVVSIFIRVASKPADDEHPYGHSQLESIGALVVGSFVITTAVAIFWNSLDTLFNLYAGVGDFTGGTGAALLVAVLTVLAKFGLTIYTRRVGNITQNASIIALAYDHRNDIISALAVVTGLSLSRMGYLWVEPLAGAFVALVILQAGIRILRESTADLMDTVPGKALRTQVLTLLKPIDEIIEIEDIHAHRFGPYLVINITIGVDGNISVREGDQIASLVEETLFAGIDLLRNVHVHYHPSHNS